MKVWRTQAMNAHKELAGAHEKLNHAYERQAQLEDEVNRLRAGGAGAPADSRTGQAHCEWVAAGTPRLLTVR